MGVRVCGQPDPANVEKSEVCLWARSRGVSKLHAAPREGEELAPTPSAALLCHWELCCIPQGKRSGQPRSRLLSQEGV